MWKLGNLVPCVFQNYFSDTLGILFASLFHFLPLFDFLTRVRPRTVAGIQVCPPCCELAAKLGSRKGSRLTGSTDWCEPKDTDPAVQQIHSPLSCQTILTGHFSITRSQHGVRHYRNNANVRVVKRINLKNSHRGVSRVSCGLAMHIR